MMFDFARKATDYQWQALKHEEQALKAADATLKDGFAALAEMCRVKAAQMERQVRRGAEASPVRLGSPERQCRLKGRLRVGVDERQRPVGEFDVVLTRHLTHLEGDGL